jgi:aminobenzoyl-glutamate transport protein
MAQSTRSGMVVRMLNAVERAGNRLPQPVTLFFILIAIVLVASYAAARLEIGVVHPNTKETIPAVNLLSRDQIQSIFTSMTTTFTGFAPLGMVLVVMLGIGVAERSGLIAVGLRAFVAWMPRWLITIALVTAGQLSSVAADAGYVVLIPLGAALFWGMGRHPLAGLAAAFAGVSGGFGANIIITGLDPLLAGITQEAARFVNPVYVVDPTANWWIMAALVPVTSIAGWIVTEWIVEPRLGDYQNAEGFTPDTGEITAAEKRGLFWAVVTLLAGLAVLAYASVPVDALFRGEQGSIRPLLDSIVPLMMIIFFLPGLVYGLVAGPSPATKTSPR